MSRRCRGRWARTRRRQRVARSARPTRLLLLRRKNNGRSSGRSPAHADTSATRTGRSRQSLWRRKELECDAVRVAETQTRAVGRVDDSAVLNAQLIEPVHPGLQCGSVRATEADMIQAHPELAEALVGCRVLMLVNSEH